MRSPTNSSPSESSPAGRSCSRRATRPAAPTTIAACSTNWAPCRFWRSSRASSGELDAQAQLARVGHHRLPPVDLLLAAIADRNRIGILHYDSDFDVILAKTDLEFASVWLAPRGEL
jgi:hypothetical protein